MLAAKTNLSEVYDRYSLFRVVPDKSGLPHWILALGLQVFLQCACLCCNSSSPSWAASVSFSFAFPPRNSRTCACREIYWEIRWKDLKTTRGWKVSTIEARNMVLVWRDAPPLRAGLREPKPFELRSRFAIFTNPNLMVSITSETQASLAPRHTHEPLLRSFRDGG
jgi:hypothetical protein